MGTDFVFPFGQPLRRVEQTDRTPKKVFVLGVYASAVHARWIGPDGKDAVKAIAVASEPYIFWRGEGTDESINRIQVPAEVGRLVSADPQFNGPSGAALDECILKPLGVHRHDAWLCDLVPHSCVNEAQQKAIDRAYMPLIQDHGLPVPSIPSVPNQLADDFRRRAILNEINESEAELLVVLGDEPIKWFIRYFDTRWRRLSDFGSHGQLHDCKIGGRTITLLPIAHPRQVARLGRSSKVWFDAHRNWAVNSATTLLR